MNINAVYLEVFRGEAQVMEETLNSVIVKARKMMQKHELRECEKMIRQSMFDYPDNAVPHNLMGLLYEKKGDHLNAMKHFRAAWALDSSYRPALMNLDCFGSVFSDNIFIFDETDEPVKIVDKQSTTQK